jgi:aminoglycoside 6-adenylyltransferase
MMRSEREMHDLIVDTARGDERIRVAILNGSRANPEAPRDIFQDWDVVFFVTDVAPFRRNPEWIGRFGELMILQMPEDMQDPPPSADGGFTYLMQFTDGNRIDLGVYPLTTLHKKAGDSLSVLLLDKDGLLEPLPPPGEEGYLLRPPGAKDYSDCCNEFWWVCPYVAKGLWRGETTYVRHMLDHVVREQLMRMLVWHIGAGTGFSRNPGKSGRYFRRYLEPDLWDMLMATYADSDPGHTWDALLAMCGLFRRVALGVAGRFGFDYPHGDDARVSAHLEHVRGLPGDAREIY